VARDEFRRVFKIAQGLGGLHQHVGSRVRLGSQESEKNR
jgi:hypothetical protein